MAAAPIEPEFTQGHPRIHNPLDLKSQGPSPRGSCLSPEYRRSSFLTTRVPCTHPFAPCPRCGFGPCMKLVAGPHMREFRGQRNSPLPSVVGYDRRQWHSGLALFRIMGSLVAYDDASLQNRPRSATAGWPAPARASHSCSRSPQSPAR